MNNAELRSGVIHKLDPDIVTISETHCNDNINNQPYIEGYKWIGHCRKSCHRQANRQFGGVGVFIKRTLLDNFDFSVVNATIEGILGILFRCKYSDIEILVVSCYLPPEDSTWGRDNNSFFAHLLALVYLHSQCDHIFICGDFNARISDTKDFVNDVDRLQERQVIDNTKNNHGETFIDFLFESKMAVLNGRIDPQYNNYTSVSSKGKAVVDYIVCRHNSLENVTEFKVLLTNDLVDEFGLSTVLSERCRSPDHSVLLCNINIQTYDENHNYCNGNNEDDFNTCILPRSERKYNFSNSPQEFMCTPSFLQSQESLIQKIEECQHSQTSLNAVYEELCNELFSHLNSVMKFTDLPKKYKLFKHIKPFWNQELTDLWQSKHAAEKSFLKYQGPTQQKYILHAEFRSKQKLFDKTLRRTERQYYRSLADSMETINTKNPRMFWQQIQKLGPPSQSKIPMMVYNNDGSTNLNKKDVFEKWKNDFCTMLNKPSDEIESNDNMNYADILSRLHDEEVASFNVEDETGLNSDITLNEVKHAIKKLKNGKSCGPDFIPNEVLKHPNITAVLHKLFNFCFVKRLTPDDWGRAIIAPIPKSATKDPHIPLNYRGISLLSCVAKIYSSVINNRIVKKVEANQTIAEEQNGFRPKRSCEEHLFVLTSVIKSKLELKQSVYAAFVDFNKAFDWVDRHLLFYKLIHDYNVKGNIYWAIKSLYRETHSCVRLNNEYSPWFNTTSGVRQGDILSPTLFNLYVNDLVQCINDLQCGIDLGNFGSLSILLYADDVVLLSQSDVGLQNMLNTLWSWCNKWRLSVNDSKTKIVHFRPKRVKRSEKVFCLHEKLLETVEEYKYLGLYLQEFLDYDFAAIKLANAGSRALGAVRNKIYNVKDIQLRTFTKLFTTGITPILDYCGSVWGFKNYKCIDDVQRKAVRYFLGLHKLCPIPAVDGEIGWISSSVRRKVQMVKLWNKLVVMDDDRLPKIVLLYNISMMNEVDNWCSQISDIFNSIGLNIDLRSLSLVDTKFVYEKLVEKQVQVWEEQRSSKIKLRNYNLFKCDMTVEPYVRLSLKKHVRSQYAQFRTGILPLMIEIGRYHGTPLEERFCPMCKNRNENYIEDEFHLLCQCTFYNTERDILYRNVSHSCAEFLNLDNFDKFLLLNMNFQMLTANFVHSAMKKRETYLYNTTL